MENKSNIVLAIAVIGLVAAVLVLAYGKSNIQTTGGVQINTISVAGNGIVTTQPDEATMNIVILTVTPTAEMAQSNNAEISTKVNAALKAAGIKEDDIETTGFNLYPRYEWNPDKNKNELKGYELRNTLKVKTSDTKNVGKYLDAATNAGANTIENVYFGLSKDKEKQVNAQALKLASGMAKEKARSIADSLGVSLGDIVTVSESNVGYTPQYYPMYARGGDMMASAKEETAISPTDIEVNAYINVAYEIN